MALAPINYPKQEIKEIVLGQTPMIDFNLAHSKEQWGSVIRYPNTIREWARFVYNFDIFVNKVPLLKLIFAFNLINAVLLWVVAL